MSWEGWEGSRGYFKIPPATCRTDNGTKLKLFNELSEINILVQGRAGQTSVSPDCLAVSHISWRLKINRFVLEIFMRTLRMITKPDAGKQDNFSRKKNFNMEVKFRSQISPNRTWWKKNRFKFGKILTRDYHPGDNRLISLLSLLSPPQETWRRPARWDQPSQCWRGFNLQPSPAQSDNFPACAGPGSSGRISLSRGGWGADGQRTLKFCLLAVAGALLHYNYTAWTSFIMAGLHSVPAALGGHCHILTLTPGQASTVWVWEQIVGKNGKILHRRERGGRCYRLYYD